MQRTVIVAVAVVGSDGEFMGSSGSTILAKMVTTANAKSAAAEVGSGEQLGAFSRD